MQSEMDKAGLVHGRILPRQCRHGLHEKQFSGLMMPLLMVSLESACWVVSRAASITASFYAASPPGGEGTMTTVRRTASKRRMEKSVSKRLLSLLTIIQPLPLLITVATDKNV